MPLSEIKFYLKISQSDYLRYYRGAASNVVAHAYDGRRIQFPAASLRPFVSHDGIEGEFVLVMDENNKLVELRRA